VRAGVTAHKEDTVSDTFHSLEPLSDPRWTAFLQRHPRASIFHTPEWLSALQRTYGYAAVAFTSARPGEELRSGLVFSNVQSWLIQPRLVSLPFSDHTDPLVDDPAEMRALADFLTHGAGAKKWHSIELRPPECAATGEWAGFSEGHTFFLHNLDLRPSLPDLFRGLHKDSIQRKIRRGERESLQLQEGRSEFLLRAFYRLTVVTRRRQGLPPPPLTWFRNVLECLGERAMIRLVLKNDQPIAAILTLHYKDTMVYKYGCSDARHHNLGAMPFVLWHTAKNAKSLGCTKLDFGRSDPMNHGLVTFKERFGAVRSTLTYRKFPAPGNHGLDSAWLERAARGVFSVLPDRLQILAGRAIYPHIG
jgi:GNAT acetyltransferase-like protein